MRTLLVAAVAAAARLGAPTRRAENPTVRGLNLWAPVIDLPTCT